MPESKNPTLVDYAIQVGNVKWRFLSLILAPTLCGVALAFFLPKEYTAATVILPPQQSNSGTANAIAQIGALTGLSAAGLGAKTPDELYVGFLRSASVQSAIVKKYDLMNRYGVDLEFDARARLADRTRAVVDKKSGLITVEVTDENPSLSAAIANDYYVQLQALLSRVAITDAQLKREFLERQVNLASRQLSDAEANFKDAQSRLGFSVTQALAEAKTREGLALRAEIAAKQVELNVLGRFATEKNVDFLKTKTELSALQARLKQLEFGQDAKDASSQSGSEGMALYRAFRVREAAYEALVKQLEMAKFDEASTGPRVQQIDVAVLPEKPSAPRKLFVVFSFFAAGLMVGLLWIAKLVWLETSHENESQLSRLKRAWLSR